MGRTLIDCINELHTGEHDSCLQCDLEAMLAERNAALAEVERLKAELETSESERKILWIKYHDKRQQLTSARTEAALGTAQEILQMIISMPAFANRLFLIEAIRHKFDIKEG